MQPVPEHRALFGIDVIGSATTPGHQRGQMSGAISELLHKALWETDIHHPDILRWEHTGDGALLTLHSSFLGKLFDLAKRLDTATATHNRISRPDIKLRIAIDLGPVGDSPGYYGPRLSHARLLNAAAFKDLLRRCMAERTDGSVNTGVIASSHAYTTAFGGDHTELAQQADFAPVTVQEKEFTGQAWISVPGFDARSITEFTSQPPAPQHTGDPPGGRVSNHISGNVGTAVQAGTINGGVTFGRNP